MERLYKRIVTIGMISVTALLAFLYCVLEYRNEIVYVIATSIVFVVSLYALLCSYIQLKLSKEDMLRTYIRETISEHMQKLQKTDDQDELLRMLKAIYVQLRKHVTSDEDQVLAASINKAIKIIVKYHQTDNDAILASITNLQTELSEIKTKLSSIKELPHVVPSDNNQTEKIHEQDDIPNENYSDNLNTFREETDSPESASPETASVATESYDSMIDNFFDTFGAGDDSDVEETHPEEGADVIPFPVADADEPANITESLNDQTASDSAATSGSKAEDAPNRPLSADEIAALFASMNAGN